MKTRNQHTPHFTMPHVTMPHLAMPHFGRHAQAMARDDHPHHHHPAYQTMKKIEGGVDLLVIALVVILALAMVYGLLTATGHPAYFDRWPG